MLQFCEEYGVLNKESKYIQYLIETQNQIP